MEQRCRLQSQVTTIGGMFVFHVAMSTSSTLKWCAATPCARRLRRLIQLMYATGASATPMLHNLYDDETCGTLLK